MMSARNSAALPIVLAVVVSPIMAGSVIVVVPVVMAALQHDPQALIVHADSPVQTWGDLNGRTVIASPSAFSRSSSAPRLTPRGT